MAWMKVGTTTLAPLTPTFEDDFTSYATQGAADAVWVEDGTGKVAVNITDNDIDFNLKTETTAHGINYDFGAGNVSDTKWTIRYKMNLTTVNTTVMYTYWGLSSVSGSGTSTTRDFIGFNTTGTTFYGHDRDGADDTGSGDNSQSYTLVTGTDYYVTIKRTSATAYTYTLQTGSFSGTTVVNGTGTCASTIVGLRYFNCRNLNNQTTAGNLIGTIDDFEFYNGVSDTSGASDNLDITGKTVRKFNQFLHHEIPTGGDASIMMTFNNDATQKYARRTSHNGGTDGEAANESNLNIGWGNADPKFYVHYWIDIAGEEKLGIAFGVNRKSAGAGNATQRVEHVLKYTDTSASITRVDTNNTLGGSYKAGSNISALGTD